jgi:hypothetical protein
MTRMGRLGLAVTSSVLSLTIGPAPEAVGRCNTLQLLESRPGQEWLWPIFLAVVIVAGLAMVVVARWQKRRLQRRLGLKINNLGNVRSRYELRADDPHGDLKFQFTLRGDSLPQRQAPETVSLDEAAPAGAKAGAEADDVVPSGSPASLEGVRRAAGWATGAGNAIADVLSTVGQLLPRSVGAPLLRVAGQLRRGGSTVRRAERLPGQMARLKPSTSSRAAAGRQAPSATHTILRTWVRTPFVEPGETLTVDLLISPVSSRPDQSHSFTVFSSSVEQGDAPPVIQEGYIQSEKASWARRYGPFLVILATAVAIVVLALWLVSTGALA